jgi:hypothetical protein
VNASEFGALLVRLAEQEFPPDEQRIILRFLKYAAQRFDRQLREGDATPIPVVLDPNRFDE